MEGPQGAEGVLSENLPENVLEMKVESRDDMLSRHRKEIQQLQNKETELKKAAAKGSKAEQKTKKKQVEEQISKLSDKLKERQVEQLASLGYADGNGTAKGNLDNLVKAIAGASVSSQPENSKPSKSVKRREKRALEDAAREQRIREEQQSIVNDRAIENEKLENKLEPLGLTVNEIKPDGHCLYRAVEDQLARFSMGPPPYSYLDLRKLVSSYMREHAPDFIPFFLSETDAEGDSVAERFESYCREIETTAAWGGQLELKALSRCLKRHIMIFSGSFPDVEMGKEYKKSSDGPEQDSLNPSIKLSYHKHAYGLGEHYNSVVPV